jgi:adenylylsulfate kinase-like enzyme
MTEADEKEIRSIVRREFIEILQDAEAQLGLKKDPTGIGRKALEGLINLIRQRDSSQGREQ